jgi:hypothetical protein
MFICNPCTVQGLLFPVLNASRRQTSFFYKGLTTRLLQFTLAKEAKAGFNEVFYRWCRLQASLILFVLFAGLVYAPGAVSGTGHQQDAQASIDRRICRSSLPGDGVVVIIFLLGKAPSNGIGLRVFIFAGNKYHTQEQA